MLVIVNGHERALPDGTTVDSVLGLLRGEHSSDGPPATQAREQRDIDRATGARDGRGIAVAVDGEVVPRSAWRTTELTAGVVVEVLIAVQGG